MQDWRKQGQERFMQGVELTRKPYKSFRASWDHDHCEFCSAKFSEIDADALREGYATNDNYHWVCEKCFSDFREAFKWIVYCVPEGDKELGSN